MPDLSFQVEGVEVVANAATPMLAFKLRLSDVNPEQTIHTVALRCQIQLEVTRVNTRLKIRSVCSICLAKPAGGVKP